MKKLFVFILILIFIFSCGEDETKVQSTIESVSKNISNSSKEITLGNSAGVKLVIPSGAVQKTQNGEDKALAITLEKSQTPSGTSVADANVLVGDVWHISPDDFIFQKSLMIEIPLTDLDLNTSYSLYRLNTKSNIWEPIPFSILDSNSTTRSLTNFITTLTGSTFSGGYYSVGGDFLHHQDTNPKRWGVMKIENFFGLRSVNYCIKDYKLKFSEDENKFFPPHDALLPKIDNLFGTNPRYIRLPQGKYQFSINRMKQYSWTEPTKGYLYDGFLTTKWYTITGTGVLDFDNTDLMDTSTFDAYIGISDSSQWIINPPYSLCTYPVPTSWGSSSSVSSASNSSSASNPIGPSNCPYSKWDNWPKPQWCPLKGNTFQYNIDLNTTAHVTCEYSDNGSLVSEIASTNTTPGCQIGFLKGYYESAALETQSHVSDGVVDDFGVIFSKNGSILTCRDNRNSGITCGN